ncbi:7TM diverse intracellular signaling domain-containing protein [Paraglaciecola sp.]|uniref:hybrid sensor histidine kinase/response regulator n=1 Tax=Paraglaciecola sp. TaxID=1920173 RepID=UPI003EF2457C
MWASLFKFLCLSLLLIPVLTLAQGDVQLISTDNTIRLSPQLKVFKETDQPLTLAQIISKKNEFTWQAAGKPNYGFSNKGVWLNTSISNVTDVQHWVLDVAYSQLEKVDIYLLLDNKIIAQSHQGVKGKPNQYRFPTLRLDIPYAQTLELYIRIENTHSGLLAPVDIQTEANHEKTSFYDNLLWGLFYGGLIMLGAYNLLLYIGLKDESLLTYNGYIISILLWQLVWGGHFKLLFPESLVSWLGSHTDLVFIIIGLSSGLFSITLLNAKENAPKTLPYIKACLVTFGVLVVCCVIGIFPQLWQNILVYFVSLVAMVCYLYAGFESFTNRFYPARYFIVSWCILICSSLTVVLHLAGVFHDNLFTSYSFQAGLFIQACLFSVALIEKNRHQLQLEVEQATQDLTNNIELVEEQNVRLDIARKDAIAASNVKSQFLANMSHEIRTPLNAILGFSTELGAGNFPPEKQEQISIINAAADNLLNIVNDVLDFSKIEAGKLQINNHPFSPNQMLEDVVGIMAKSAHLKNLEFIYNLSPLPEKLIGDSYRIKQILNNLLGNALKFTDTGQIYLSVKGIEKEHGIYELELKIEDSGIGISKEDQRKLFAAFSQVDDALSRSYQGTGLGLVICQELVKMMHGDLTLQSAQGIGSIFTVNIRVNLLNTTLSIKPDGNWKDKNIIYFDPNPMSRYCGVKILTAMGGKVTGVESLAFLRQLTQPQDTLFICIPGNKASMLPSILEASRHINATNKIMLYSGVESLSARSDLSQYFSNKLRLPLTLGKLNSLMNVPTKSPVNVLQQRLQALPKARVLAVDDMEMNLRLLTTWLKNSKLQLTLALSGKDAVEHCQEHEFDLILMDVQMPHMDGLQATRLIRQTPLNLGTPIIAVTAHAFKEEQDRLLSSGMDDYLPKPINLSDLIDLIKRWCQITDATDDSIPSFDWELALKNANYNKDAAQDLLRQFILQLPELAAEIETHNRQENYSEMQSSVHKLHGVCCYTGVPALQQICDKVESSLKLQQIVKAQQDLPMLIDETAKVLETVKQDNQHLFT